MENSPSQRSEWLFLLVDDDPHSAKFFRRRMAAIAQDKVNLNLDWFESPARALSAIKGYQSNAQNRFAEAVPNLIIIDLKFSSNANLGFMNNVMPMLRAANIPLVTFIANDDAAVRNVHLEAGASDCFTRHSELSRYDAELTRMLALTRRLQSAA